MPETIQKTIIQKRPNVCGGDACIGNQRVAVWVVVAYRQLGRDDKRLMNMFDPPLTREELEAAFEYYEQNRAEIDMAIRDNETGFDSGD